MKLENLNVQELNVQQLLNTNGGIWREVLMYLAEYYVENAKEFSNRNHMLYKLGHVGGGRP